MRHRTLLFLLGLALVVAVPAQGADTTHDTAPFLAAGQPAECSALVLSAAAGPHEIAAFEDAKIAFLAWRAASPSPSGCAASDDPSVGTTTAAVKECGDCSDCLSAASCLGCAVGAVCSPPGTSPTRACRAIKQCSNGKYCCGCS